MFSFTSRPQFAPSRLGRKGSAILEFAIMGPVLILLLMGIMTAGLLFNNYLNMTNGVSAAAQQLALARGNTSTPYSAATTVFQANFPKTGISVAIAGTPCASDAACQQALAANQNQSIVVSASYQLPLPLLAAFGMSKWNLSAQTTEYVQ